MPIHLSTWKVIKRAAVLTRVATVGMGAGMGRVWGPQGVKDVRKAIKKRDQDRDLRVYNITKFIEKVDSYRDRGIPDEELAKVRLFGMEYFLDEASPEASFIKHPDSAKLKRIEIKGSKGWHVLWSDA